MIHDIKSALNVKCSVQTKWNWGNTIFYGFINGVVSTFLNSTIHFRIHYLQCRHCTKKTKVLSMYKFPILEIYKHERERRGVSPGAGGRYGGKEGAAPSGEEPGGAPLAARDPR
ncbi:Os02g0803225 [Oryza sativa Japonica Group]|uniref:Os02g0803225 protein n=1 Tax=Oryza sativa subsp. japonica TaxID=39947 RepID=A0A0P0VQV2_ORYSJ|nr:hypothetical protein EE612_014291 [Oryza sativa]BAS81436.1 Os02g0803225 [Oryza sativa Japonica Group]